MDILKQVFNPSTYAALRNVLSALGVLMGMLGIVALSPQQIDKIIAIAQQLGTTVAAVAAFAGLLMPLIMGGIAAFKGTQKSNIARTATIAQDTSQPLAEDAKQALIAATIAQPSVQAIVTDKTTADAAPSESVVAADSVTITPPTK